MKINIGPYKDWLGPYQLAEKLCFWVKDVHDEYGIRSKPDWVHDVVGEFLAHGFQKKNEDFDFMNDDRSNTWLYNLLLWIDKKKKRNVDIQINKYDTWSMDATLALVIVPMLKQLRDTTHGYPADFAKDDQSNWSGQEQFEGEGFEYPEDIGAAEWEATLNKMIWAFEQVNEDWEEQYHSGEIDLRFEKIDKYDSKGGQYSQMVEGPNHTSVTDKDGIRRHQERMQEGFDLFGKYYSSLWD